MEQPERESGAEDRVQEKQEGEELPSCLATNMPDYIQILYCANNIKRMIEILDNTQYQGEAFNNDA